MAYRILFSGFYLIAKNVIMFSMGCQAFGTRNHDKGEHPLEPETFLCSFCGKSTNYYIIYFYK